MRRKFWLGTLAAALILSLGWGINEYRLAGQYRVASENDNRRAFGDLAGNLDQLETVMAKGQVATSPNQQVMYLSQISDRSDGALRDFAQLPAQQAGLSYIGQFLNQSADFASTLATKVAGGGTISADEQKTLQSLHDRIIPVNQKVQALQTQMETEKLAWTDSAPSLRQRLGLGGPQIAEAAADSSEGPAKSVRSGLDQLDASLQKLPPLTYSGEYSSRVVQKPLGLPSGQVTRAQAQTKARDFLIKVGYAGSSPAFSKETKGDFPGYSFTYKDAYMEISRLGGVVTYYRDQRDLNERKLSMADAAKKVQGSLKALGWNLALTSSEDNGAYANFEAVAEQNGVRLYPDKVRIMVALDNGQLIGLDATPYYAFHHTRNLPDALPMAQVARKLRTGFKVQESRLVLIPQTGNKEVLAFEFRGRYQGEDYLIYLNATNGNEEKIQRIIKTPRGEYLQ